VTDIVRVLRRELAVEVRYAEARVAAGRSVSKVLSVRSRRISPMGCYIVAQRAGRAMLADRFRAAAVEQHAGCPLYRQASQKLLPPELYPVEERTDPGRTDLISRRSRHQVQLN
jgi:hypothetical protein